MKRIALETKGLGRLPSDLASLGRVGGPSGERPDPRTLAAIHIISHHDCHITSLYATVKALWHNGM